MTDIHNKRRDQWTSDDWNAFVEWFANASRNWTESWDGVPGSETDPWNTDN